MRSQVVADLIQRLERIVTPTEPYLDNQPLDRDDRNAIRCAIELLKETTS
jgi:hypothetical protein